MANVKTTNECYAYFMVSGSFDPAQITERVKVDPSESSLEGDPIKGSKMLRKCSRWTLRSRLDTTLPFEEHVSDVLSQLDAKKEVFKQLSAEFGGVMELVGYFNAYYPGLSFESNLITRLSEYNLAMDCDFYYLADED